MLGIVAAGIYFAYGVIAPLGRGFRGLDVYSATLPNFVYASRALSQGHGLLWNELQNCGRPFFASIQMALLSPVNWLSLIADPEAALLPTVAVNLAIGGAGMYFLSRELGLGRLAAFCAALAFELGGVCGELARWSSYLIASYAWLPTVALFCERIVRAPRVRSGLGLAAALTLMLLAGFPQILAFAYQWVALRTLWALASLRGEARLRTLRILALGLLLPPLFGAIQLLPSSELAAESVRNRTLTLEEMQPGTADRHGFRAFRQKLEDRMPGVGGLFPVVAIVLAGLAFAAPSRRRMAVFYLASGIVFFALAFSPHVFEAYQQLPTGRLFRRPARFVWITGFSFSVLVGFGTQVLSDFAALARRDRAIGVAAVVCGLATFHLLSPNGFMVWEWGLVAATLALLAGALAVVQLRPVARLVLPTLLVCNLIVLSLQPPRESDSGRFEGPIDLGVLRRSEWAFDLVKRLGSVHDRVYPLAALFDYTLTHKTPSIFGVPSIADYENVATRRYAELFVHMLWGRPMRALNDFSYPEQWIPRDRALLDLLAGRYLIVDATAGEDVATLRPAPTLLERRASLSVYENLQALPRAFYVPRIEVVEDPGELLARLASRDHRPRSVALVEQLPDDGFQGVEPLGAGVAKIAASRSEVLEVDVSATQAGFLFLSDQYYPGWVASVDGTPTPILRANYVFRVVRVPAGDSKVVFRYRPRSLYLGASVSGITLLGVVVYAAAGGSRRRQRTDRPAPGPG